jgi:molecular chaperone GrpE
MMSQRRSPASWSRSKPIWPSRRTAPSGRPPISTASASERRAAEQKEALIRELLPVIDNLERALASDQSTSPQQLREGVQITLRQLNQLLRHHGIESEDSVGQPFDPHRHDALRVGHDASKPDHTILEVFERGYRRGNEVFRPAKVVVNDLSDAGPTGYEA